MPTDWPSITAAIRARSGNRCECADECGLHRGRRCTERHGEKAFYARSGRVLLEVVDGKALCGVCAELVRIAVRKRERLEAKRRTQLELEL
jgi:hypothetical protein